MFGDYNSIMMMQMSFPLELDSPVSSQQNLFRQAVYRNQGVTINIRNIDRSHVSHDFSAKLISQQDQVWIEINFIQVVISEMERRIGQLNQHILKMDPQNPEVFTLSEDRG
jgi:hypothetical protein